MAIVLRGKIDDNVKHFSIKLLQKDQDKNITLLQLEVDLEEKSYKISSGENGVKKDVENFKPSYEAGFPFEAVIKFNEKNSENFDILMNDTFVLYDYKTGQSINGIDYIEIIGASAKMFKGQSNLAKYDFKMDSENPSFLEVFGKMLPIPPNDRASSFFIQLFINNVGATSAPKFVKNTTDIFIGDNNVNFYFQNKSTVVWVVNGKETAFNSQLEEGFDLLKYYKLGYLNRPDATAETVDEQGWLKTGDIGYQDEHGWTYVVDRLKELIKVKGLQVAPAELEDLLLSNPDIKDCAVIGVPDQICGEVPKAFVVKANEKLDENGVKEFIKGKVAPFKQLKFVEFVDEIPKSPSGKILRRILRNRQNSG